MRQQTRSSMRSAVGFGGVASIARQTTRAGGVSRGCSEQPNHGNEQRRRTLQAHGVFSLFSLSIPRANRFAQAKDLQALLKEKGLATSGELTSFAEPLLVVCCRKTSFDFPLLGKKAELIQRLLDASESGFIPWQSSYPFLLSPFFWGGAHRLADTTQAVSHDCALQ
jgi:hypothetical protein